MPVGLLGKKVVVYFLFSTEVQLGPNFLSFVKAQEAQYLLAKADFLGVCGPVGGGVWGWGCYGAPRVSYAVGLEPHLKIRPCTWHCC